MPSASSTLPARRHRFSTAAAICMVVVVAVFWISRAFPFLPQPLSLQVRFPTPGQPTEKEPLLSTGEFRAGDFLNLQFLENGEAVIGYDAWGAGGPTSQKFELRPGQLRQLQVEMPALGRNPQRIGRDNALVRVVLDGREILNAPATFHSRRADEVFFGSNPIGGNTFGIRFRGTLVEPHGRQLEGGPDSYFTWRERAACWFTRHPGQIALTLLLGVVGGFVLLPTARWTYARRPSQLRARTIVAAGKAAPHGTFTVMLVLCGIVFTWLETYGTFKFPFEESFGTFYDHQAASLLHGKLDVPEPSLSGEAFVVNGKVYGYFGPTPAVMRMPFVAAGIAFGKLSRTFVLLDYLAALGASYALLLFAVRRLNGAGASPSRGATALFMAAVGLGSTLFFLGSRPYIYHEAILCGAAFGLWSVWFSLRQLETPARRRWIGAWVCALGAMHARPPAGLFAFGALGCVALVHFGAAARDRRLLREALLIAAFVVVGVASFSGMSYLKFRTLDGSPLRYSVQYTPERRARFNDKNFHLVNLHHNIDTYLLGPNFHFEKNFPWVYFGGYDVAYPDAKIDLDEPALAFPYAMPALFLLAIGGGIWAYLWVPALRFSLVVLAVAVVPMALALFTAIVTSHRYTGDFCPFFIASAACGLAVWDGESPRLRRIALALTTLAVVWSCYVTFALSIHFQRHDVWGVPEPARKAYEEFRQRVDGYFGVKKADN